MPKPMRNLEVLRYLGNLVLDLHFIDHESSMLLLLIKLGRKVPMDSCLGLEPNAWWRGAFLAGLQWEIDVRIREPFCQPEFSAALEERIFGSRLRLFMRREEYWLKEGRFAL